MALRHQHRLALRHIAHPRRSSIRPRVSWMSSPMPVLPGARRETSAAHGPAPRGDIDSWAQHWPIRRAGFGRMDRRPCGNFARRIKALAIIRCRKRAISSTPPPA
jgi:hypothetical protein